ncbi:MAG TPA: hypothetical protein VG501_04735 [Rhizomicrobium sp.]|nr:hypothetical protein [Rhizomicrobium sp.]
MTTKSPRVLLAAVLLAGTALLSTAATAAPSLSSSVASRLTDAQNAAKKQDWPAASAAVAAARTSAKSDFDTYMINRVAISVAFNMNDTAAAAQAAEDAADSPAQPDAEKFTNAKLAIQLSTVAKHYDKAMRYAKALEGMKESAADPQIPGLVSQAYYFGGDFASAKAAAQRSIDAEVKAGKTPDKQSLEILMSAEVGLKDDAGAQQTLEDQVKYYNDPADWAQMIDVAITQNGIRDVDAIWLGRLLFAVGAKVTQDDANMIGAIAGHLTFFGDAVNAKTHGAVVDPDPVPRADADKKTLDQQIAAANAQNGTYSAKLAEALFSYGMYDKAEQMAQLSLSKGGNAQDPSESQMVLAQSQAMQGKYDDALANFGKVTGGGPATPRVARLWSEYVNLKKNPPAPPASPAQANAK